MSMPRINSYGQYSSDNYGAHCLVVSMGSVTVWFSYKTPIAFHVDGHSRVVHQNDWGPTTGKHLKWIDGGDKDAKKRRVDDETFERLWKERVDPILRAGEQVRAEAEANSEFRVPVSV